MKESTKIVYSAVSELHHRYYYQKRRDNAWKNGGERQRFNQFFERAMALHKIAETEAAHARIDRFVKSMLDDATK